MAAVWPASISAIRDLLPQKKERYATGKRRRSTREPQRAKQEFAQPQEGDTCLIDKSDWRESPHIDKEIQKKYRSGDEKQQRINAE